MEPLDDLILNNILRTDDNNIVLQKEDDRIEFKEIFDNTTREAKAKYAKELAALSNYEGGYLIFGIHDESNELLGLVNFAEPDNVNLVNDINTYFSPAIRFQSRLINVKGKHVFVIYVEKRSSIPTVCIKSHQKELKESTIYWRYSAQSAPIKSGDLINLLNLNSDFESNNISKLQKYYLMTIQSDNYSEVIENEEPEKMVMQTKNMLFAAPFGISAIVAIYSTLLLLSNRITDSWLIGSLSLVLVFGIMIIIKVRRKEWLEKMNYTAYLIHINGIEVEKINKNNSALYNGEVYYVTVEFLGEDLLGKQRNYRIDKKLRQKLNKGDFGVAFISEYNNFDKFMKVRLKHNGIPTLC